MAGERAIEYAMAEAWNPRLPTCNKPLAETQRYTMEFARPPLL